MKNLASIIILSALIFSCKKESTTITSTDVQGQWEQPEFQEGVNEGVLHEIELCEGNFKLQLHHFTDAISPEHNCSFARWTEYVAGSYIVENNTVLLNGYYAYSDFTRKIDGCHNTGDYNKSYSLVKKVSNLEFTSTSSGETFQLDFVSKTNCDLKE